MSLTEVEQHCPDETPYADKLELQSLFCQAYASAGDKVAKYKKEEGQPGILFLKNLRFFDPSKLIFMPNVIEGIPKFEEIPQEEIDLYRNHLGPQALMNAPTSALDLQQFWLSVQLKVPTLAKFALKYIFATVHSADVERSFSLYNIILSDRRRSLTPENLKKLIFLYYNQFAGIEIFY